MSRQAPRLLWWGFQKFSEINTKIWNILRFFSLATYILTRYKLSFLINLDYCIFRCAPFVSLCLTVMEIGKSQTWGRTTVLSMPMFCEFQMFFFKNLRKILINIKKKKISKIWNTVFSNIDNYRSEPARANVVRRPMLARRTPRQTAAANRQTAVGGGTNCKWTSSHVFKFSKVNSFYFSKICNICFRRVAVYWNFLFFVIRFVQLRPRGTFVRWKQTIGRIDRISEHFGYLQVR